MPARRPPPPDTAASPSTWRRDLLLTLGAALVFTGVALWCLRAVLPRWHEAYAGGGELEGWLWRYWWMKNLILDAWQFATAKYALYVALVSGSYPETGNVFELQALSMPLDALVGAPDYYNLKIVVVLVLNGLAGYWLARLLVDDWAASVLCGFAFAFGSYVLLEIETGRMRQALVFPLALYAITLMRLSSPRASMGWAVLGGLAFGLCSTVFLFYGMSAAFMSVLWLVWLGAPLSPGPSADLEQRRAAVRSRVVYVLLVVAVVSGFAQCMVAHVSASAVGGVFGVALLALVAWIVWRDGGRRLAHFVILGAVALTASLPYATWYVEQAFVKKQALPEVTWRKQFPSLEALEDPLNVHASDDALMNSMQRFRGDSVSWDFPFSVEYRRGVPVVLTALVLGGLLLFPRRPWLFVGVMGLGWALSLGPYLKAGISEEYVMRPHGIELPQAYFFEYVPFFSRLFSPIRMEGLFLLGFGVLAAWSCATLFRRLNLVWPLRIVVVAAFIGLSLAQMGRANTIPLSWTPLQVPDVYPWIAASDADGVVEIPLREGDYVNYYQMFHGKRVLDGWASGSIPEGYPMSRTRWLAETPMRVNMDNSFLQWLRSANEGEHMSVKQYDPAALKEIAGLGYRWALLHERGCYIVKGPDGHAQYIFMRQLLDRVLGKPVKTSSERVRERWTENIKPDADGLYTYEIVVYDLKALAK